MHASIPTTYRGIRFRSRLEAKWATVFDLLGWSWEYEPLDLNGWIPDFLIRAKYKPILVEVKPIVELDQKVTKKIEGVFGYTDPGIGEEITSISNDYDILILALAPFVCKYEGSSCIGWITDDFFGSWQTAVVIEPTENKSVYGLASGTSGYYADRITGVGDGDHYYSQLYADDLREMWARATNATQWKAPR